MDNEGFYKLMEEQEDVPKTSQITSYQFEELYYECYQKGCTDVILVMINSKGSATYQNSLLAIDTFLRSIRSVRVRFLFTVMTGAVIPAPTASR